MEHYEKKISFLGENIQTIRKHRGMKQQELADKIGINMQSLSKIERGVNYPTFDTLEKIMDVLGVTPNELLSGEWKYVNQAEKEVCQFLRIEERLNAELKHGHYDNFFDSEEEWLEYELKKLREYITDYINGKSIVASDLYPIKEFIQHLKFQKLLDHYDDLYSMDMFGESIEGHKYRTPYQVVKMINPNSKEDMELLQAVALIAGLIVDVGLKTSLVYLIVGIADLIYQKHKFKEEMKMTKQEVKDEYKNTEGDPQIKGRQRQRMREASQRRMMQDVPKADVVITNPTHYAVAIRYDAEVSKAPVVVAKGEDFLAAKIKEVARENQVEIVENKPLARMLYANVNVGAEIPPELYQAVAEVLAMVYNLKGRN